MVGNLGNVPSGNRLGPGERCTRSGCLSSVRRRCTSRGLCRWATRDAVLGAPLALMAQLAVPRRSCHSVFVYPLLPTPFWSTACPGKGHRVPQSQAKELWESGALGLTGRGRGPFTAARYAIRSILWPWGAGKWVEVNWGQLHSGRHVVGSRSLLKGEVPSKALRFPGPTWVEAGASQEARVGCITKLPAAGAPPSWAVQRGGSSHTDAAEQKQIALEEKDGPCFLRVAYKKRHCGLLKEEEHCSAPNGPKGSLQEVLRGLSTCSCPGKHLLRAGDTKSPFPRQDLLRLRAQVMICVIKPVSQTCSCAQAVPGQALQNLRKISQDF
ncbi:uncharacterized protein LOC107326392 isoform X3 [Python bivittatus]|uniref:Uncharacterized protein LOC107326392 isoform X3 n=1 Tax=Python bivittatus TaxID=176946 RepID=A0A9F5J8F0_PYTBI|nr:uncharacterized protein LOC107326392 isoform X3 [Python bivittatus]XP_025029264.1 uncharacterized protein LOC107326392 isoform X3 [Python bivittatus]